MYPRIVLVVQMHHVHQLEVATCPTTPKRTGLLTSRHPALWATPLLAVALVYHLALTLSEMVETIAKTELRTDLAATDSTHLPEAIIYKRLVIDSANQIATRLQYLRARATISTELVVVRETVELVPMEANLVQVIDSTAPQEG